MNMIDVESEEESFMKKKQPFIVSPPGVHLPQLPPQQLVARRQQYPSPPLQQNIIRRPPNYPPHTPMPHQRTGIDTRLPDTPPIILHYHSSRSPFPRQLIIPAPPIRTSIPRKAAYKEPDLRESLVGCAVLLVIAILTLILLYYLS